MRKEAVVSFDRSRYKLFSRKFSNTFVLAPSCERPKTATRTLFLSFESNNCFPITVWCRRLMKKSGKLACHMMNSNIAFGSSADAPNIGRNVSVIWKDLLWSSDSYPLLKYSGGCGIPLFLISVRCEKCVAARHYCAICKQFLNANDINRVRSYRMGPAPISLKIWARIE